MVVCLPNLYLPDTSGVLMLGVLVGGEAESSAITYVDLSFSFPYMKNILISRLSRFLLLEVWCMGQ